MTATTTYKLAFGTDGVRGPADGELFSKQSLFAFGRAIALWAQQKFNVTTPVILIGSDTRLSSPRIKNDLCRGLVYGGAHIIDACVIPTPAICKLILSLSNTHVGIVVSASHNPYTDNGIKIFDSQQCKLTANDENLIKQLTEEFFNAVNDKADVPFSTHNDDNHIAIWDQAAEVYQKKILSYFTPQMLNNVHVVLDCAHGATYELAPAIFRTLGAQVTVIAGSPNGKNINEQCGALHPEILAEQVCALRADCGFAFDGDGDRVIAVSKQGMVKNGDDILAILLQFPEYYHVLQIIGTIMTNQGFEQFLTNRNKQLIRTKVGDKYITAMLEQMQLPLGGEASGHIIMRDYMPTGDGIFVALKILESIMVNNNWDMKTFDKYPQVLLNVPIDQKKDLTQGPVAQIIADYQQQLKGGRLVVRYSGTEALLRIMTEAASIDIASSVAHDVASKLQEVLKLY